MLVSATALLGATLGTVSGVLTLCGLSLLCKSCKKGKLEKGDETDPEKAKPSILHTLTQFSLQKCTEPIQPQASLKFPKIYRPKPSVTSQEVIHYKEHGAANDMSAAELDTCNQATEREVFSLPWQAENISVNAGCEGYISGCVSVSEEQKHAQTAVHKLAAHVQWEEELVFALPVEGTEDTDALDGEVALSLHCCDRFSHNSTLGTMRFKLADVSMMLDADCWVDLQPPKQQEVTSSAGELLLSLSYLPAANRLGVVVMKARGLQSDKMKDNIDLSVKLTLKHQNAKLKKKQTRRVKHKMNPVWNEMMMLELPSELLAKSSVDLEVLNLASPGTLHPLGRCMLGLHTSGTGLQHWKQMLDNPRKQIAMWHPLYT
ncbi:synaptotagmin-13 isoform X3 [Rhinichthys klamathensis goyatoka]|uniref:synaptotagmin-13 isoform X3 n=1 Tax=Rhinichthys klamathensis goyatoka TaxID=3034132 RepID=UPI0024B5AD7B|nr:synaptotagmin-13 isoform X3 [Rhinichthys klamathensis goyatoka]